MRNKEKLESLACRAKCLVVFRRLCSDVDLAFHSFGVVILGINWYLCSGIVFFLLSFVERIINIGIKC